jgi:hypothetical protein
MANVKLLPRRRLEKARRACFDSEAFTKCLFRISEERSAQVGDEECYTTYCKGRYEAHRTKRKERKCLSSSSSTPSNVSCPPPQGDSVLHHGQPLLFLHHLQSPLQLLLPIPRLLASDLTPTTRHPPIILRQDVARDTLDSGNSSAVTLASEVALDVLARARLGMDLLEEGAEGVDFGAKMMAFGLQGGVAVG